MNSRNQKFQLGEVDQELKEFQVYLDRTYVMSVCADFEESLASVREKMDKEFEGSVSINSLRYLFKSSPHKRVDSKKEEVTKLKDVAYVQRGQWLVSIELRNFVFDGEYPDFMSLFQKTREYYDWQFILQFIGSESFTSGFKILHMTEIRMVLSIEGVKAIAKYTPLELVTRKWKIGKPEKKEKYVMKGNVTGSRAVSESRYEITVEVPFYATAEFINEEKYQYDDTVEVTNPPPYVRIDEEISGNVIKNAALNGQQELFSSLCKAKPIPFPEEQKNEVGTAYHIIGTLNPTQRAAIEATEAQALSLIQGPPGTGKTQTIIALTVKLFLQGKKVLICSPSNEACKNIVDRIGEVPELKSNFYQELSMAREDFLEIDVDSLHDNRATKQLYSCSRDAKYDDEVIMAIQRCEGRVVDMSRKDVAKMIRQTQKGKSDLIMDKSNRIVVSTCSRMKRYVGDASHEFDVVIVDEAGQASYPDVVDLALMTRRLVLVGDQQQLAPQIEGPFRGPRSLFEQLAKAGFPCSMLRECYRMHKEILHVPNKLFYESKILCKYVKPVRGVMVNIKRPICFVDLKSKEDFVGSSAVNDAEAKFVCGLLQALCREKRVHSSQIGFISPYQAQVAKVQSYLNKSDRDLAGIPKTIDSYQGRESDIIIMSTVRSNSQGNLGFLTNYNRVNVALTRAKHLLVIVGNYPTLNADKNWSELIDCLYERGCYFDNYAVQKVIDELF